MRQLKSQPWLVRLLCLAVLLAGWQTGGAVAQQRRLAAKPAPKKVKLIVGIVIDQFRYEYLTRFADQFTQGGFRRLLDGGAVFANANYIHASTKTACGHATFMTGSTPALNGIIANEWYDREAKKRLTSVIDHKVKLVGGKEGASGMSPMRLLGSTLGDELKFASLGKAKVIGMSFKDRSAILPVGHRPDAAYWFDLNTGNMVSSTYYLEKLPEWVQQFNRTQHPSTFVGAKWERLLPEAAYARSAPDNAAYEKSDLGVTFPHVLTGDEAPEKYFKRFEKTPFANERLAAFAKAALENEQLGADDETDLLTISFSANDLAGHDFGPYSHEVQDITLRTDRVLAELFSYLDRKLGPDRVLIALTADHGVAPVPEHVRTLGYGGRINSKNFAASVDAALDQRFGAADWVADFYSNNIYLNEEVIAQRKLDVAEIEAFASQFIVKTEGVAECYTRTQLLAGRLPDTRISRLVVNSFHSQRNGNLIVVSKPFYVFNEGTSIADHGSPYSYDTHVPVILYGPGIAPGFYYNESSPADIAPTLAALIQVETPSNSVGRVLSEAFRK